MSEIRAPYITTPTSPKDGIREIRCTCGTFLGFEVGEGDDARMMIGNHLVTGIISVCSDCGKKFRWKPIKKVYNLFVDLPIRPLPED